MPSHLLTGALVFTKAEQTDKNEIKFPGLPQVCCLVCMLGCWLLFFGLGCFVLSTCQPVQDPSAGALSSLLRVVGAPLGSPGVRSFLCTYLSCRCPVSL